MFKAFSASRVLVLVVLLVGAVPSHAVTPGDYDGDGRSDLAVGTLGATSASIKVLSTGTSAISAFSVSKKTPTYFAPGHFVSGRNELPVVVSLEKIVDIPNLPSDVDLPKFLVWYDITTSTPYALNALGEQGEVPTPGDFDCDGITDYATVKVEGGQWAWSFMLSAGVTPDTIYFGSKLDRIMAADVDGDGCSELVYIRQKAKKTAEWHYRKYNTKNERIVRWGKEGDIPLKPLDFDGDGVPDFTVVRAANGVEKAYVRLTSTGGTQVTTLGSEKTVPLAGNFTGANGFAYFNRSGGYFVVKNQDGSESRLALGDSKSILIRPDGSLVGPGVDERLYAQTSDPSKPGSAPYDPLRPFNPVRCDEQFSNRDGNGGFVWNPKNSHNTVKVIMPGEYTGSIVAMRIAKGKTIVDNLYHQDGNEYGNRERWYGNRAVGYYPANSSLIVQLYDGTQMCTTIKNARLRYD